MQKTALVVEGDTNTALALTKAVNLLGFSARTASTLKEAKSLYRDEIPDIVLLDVMLPDGDGLDLMLEVNGAGNTPFVVITGDSRQEVAVRSLRARAADFLIKPVTFDNLKNAIEKSLSASHTNKIYDPIHETYDKQALGRVLATAATVDSSERSDLLLVGESRSVKTLKQTIQQLALVNSNLVISGEAGVDKVAAAFALHRRTPSSDFIAHVHCATGNVTVGDQHSVNVFSEFMRSVFSTNRDNKRRTIVLDDVEQLSEIRQQELLNLIVDRNGVEPGNNDVPRIVCIKRNHREITTDSESPDHMEGDQVNGQLRGFIPELQQYLLQDHLAIPALRQRREDILPISHKLLESMNREYKTNKYLSEDAYSTVHAYDWPGNVRELVNVLSQAFQNSSSQLNIDDGILSEQASEEPVIKSAYAMVGNTFWQVEKALLQATLESHSGDKKTAAKTLGISLKTLYNRMKAYNLK